MQFRRVTSALVGAALALTVVGGSLPASAAPTPGGGTPSPTRPVSKTPSAASTKAPAAPRAADVPQNKELNGKQYGLVWNDEFEGTKLGSDWVTRTEPENGSMKYVNKMDPASPGTSNIVVGDGVVTLKAYPDKSYGDRFAASSGSIHTSGQQSWKYGLIEARMKFPTEQGMWPALWMMPDQNPYGWPRDGEIDWIEYPRSASRSQNQTVLHTSSQYSPREGNDSAATAFYDAPGGADLANDWHTYSMEWTETGFKYYIDGKMYGSQDSTLAPNPAEWSKNSSAYQRWDSSWKNENGMIRQDSPAMAPFDKNFFLIFNLGVRVGKGWASAPADYVIDPAKSQTSLDYVRVYQTEQQKALQNQKFIKFDPLGNSTDALPDRTVAKGTTVGELPTPRAGDGKVFAGWYTNRQLSGAPVTAATVIGDDTTLFAKWNPPLVTVTVTFDNRGHGAVTAPKTVGEGADVALPRLTASGWKFEGWYSDAELTKPVTSPFKAVADTTLYAKWSEAPHTANTLFDVRLDGTFDGTTYQPAADDIVAGTVTRRSGNEKIAAGQVTTTSGRDALIATTPADFPVGDWQYVTTPFIAETDAVINSVSAPKEDAPPTLISATGNLRVDIRSDGRLQTVLDYMDASGKWVKMKAASANPLTTGRHRISMAYLPTDTTTEVRVFLDGQEVSKLTSPMPAEGNPWNAGNDIAFGNSANRTQPWPAQMTIDRIRVAKTDTVTFTPAELRLQPVTVAYEMNGGGAAQAATAAMPGEPFELPTPTAEGLQFGGWFTDAGLIRPAASPFTTETATKLYAKWQVAISYDLHGKGAAIEPTIATLGQPMDLPKPTAPGQTFDGWYADSGYQTPVASPFTPSAATTLHAKWYAAAAPCTIGKQEGRVPLQVNSAGQTYDLMWQDEFCGNTLDMTKWRLGNEPENGAMKYLNQMGNPDNTKNNIYLQDGALNLRAIPLTEEQKKQYPGMLASSGLITNQGIDSWKYGRYEARLKSPDQQGFWPALWMMPDQNPYGWPKDGEIDWFETIGADKTINHTSLQTSSFPERTWRQGQWKTNPVEYRHDKPLGDEFHDYAMEWEPGKFTFYFDGKQVGVITQWEDSWVRADGTRYEGFPPEPFDKKFFFIANLAVVSPGGWGDAPNATTDWNRTFQLDYVRAYQTAEQRAQADRLFVKFDNNGTGASTAARTVDKGTVLRELPTLTEPGRKFEGWYLDHRLTRRATLPLTINDDTTLIAKWSGCAVSNGFQIDEPICALWRAEPRLGQAVDVGRTLADGGKFQVFQNGSVYWSARTGAHPVWGAIRDGWANQGWERGRLGYPTSGETCDAGGCQQKFEGGTLLWSLSGGAHPVWGGQLDPYLRQGGPGGTLGYPTSDEVCGIRDGGCYQNFAGGATIWSPGTGSYFSRGLIREKWGSLGFENGRLGYPTSDEVCGIKDGGCYQNFAGGAILWSPATGARASWGLIRAKYAELGFELGQLGLPTSDEICGIKDGGCYQNFQGGAIVWSPATGAHPSWGEIRRYWGANGYEFGRFGLPVSGESCGMRDEWTCVQSYQGGVITWSLGRGARG